MADLAASFHPTPSPFFFTISSRKVPAPLLTTGNTHFHIDLKISPKPSPYCSCLPPRKTGYNAPPYWFLYSLCLWVVLHYDVVIKVEIVKVCAPMNLYSMRSASEMEAYNEVGVRREGKELSFLVLNFDFEGMQLLCL